MNGKLAVQRKPTAIKKLHDRQISLQRFKSISTVSVKKICSVIFDRSGLCVCAIMAGGCSTVCTGIKGLPCPLASTEWVIGRGRQRGRNYFYSARGQPLLRGLLHSFGLSLVTGSYPGFNSRMWVCVEWPENQVVCVCRISQAFSPFSYPSHNALATSQETLRFSTHALDSRVQS